MQMDDDFKVLFSEVLDDFTCTVIAVPDYNAEPVATLFVSGYPLLVVDPGNSDDPYSFTEISSTYARQAWVGFMMAIGEGDESYESNFTDAIGTEHETDAFNTFGEYTDGHELCAYVDRITDAIKLYVESQD